MYVRLTIQTTDADVAQIIDTLKACGLIKGGLAVDSVEPLPPDVRRALALAGASASYQEPDALDQRARERRRDVMENWPLGAREAGHVR